MHKALAFVMIASSALAQVTWERLIKSASEPHNWLTYSGSTMSQRHSTLDQVTPANIERLEQKWVFQAESLQKFETTPLVVDGIMYLTQPSNDVVALDAKTGRIFWMYRYKQFSGREALLWRGESRAGDSGRHAVHGDTGCASGGDRRKDGQANLEYQGGGRR